MRLRVKLAGLLLALAACGGPVLQNAPRPNPTVVAGVAAATAAAITLAAPDATAKNVEDTRREGRVERDGPAGSRETAPAAVLDRLDAARAPTPAASPPRRGQLYDVIAIPLLRPAQTSSEDSPDVR